MEIRTYDSAEEMFADMAAAEEAAEAATCGVQRSVTWGSYWWRIVDYGGKPLVILGRCYTREEAMAAEIAAGADEEEARYSDEALAESHERGYLFGWAYSAIEPDGELGSTHRSNVWPISKEWFDRFQECNFSTGAVFRTYPEYVAEFDSLYQAARTHFLGIL